MHVTPAADPTARIDSCRLQAVSAAEIAVCNQNRPTASTTAVDTVMSQGEIRYFIRPLDARNRALNGNFCNVQHAVEPATEVAG
jgi:hypothetical protein